MNKIALLIVVITFSGIGFAAGTYYGFKEGINNLNLLEKVVQGALSRHQLASIKEDKLESVIHLHELNIDIGLHRYARYQELGNKMLSEHFMSNITTNLNDYVDLMAEYRKGHPIVYSSEWALPTESDDEQEKALLQQRHRESVEMLDDIKKLLLSRGVPESALTSQGALLH